MNKDNLTMPLRNCANCEHHKEIPYPIILPKQIKSRVEINPFYFDYCCECNRMISEVDLLTYCNSPCKYWKEKEN